MNLRPLGYEPSELPDCSTPRHVSWDMGAGLRKLGTLRPPRAVILSKEHPFDSPTEIMREAERKTYSKSGARECQGMK